MRHGFRLLLSSVLWLCAPPSFCASQAVAGRVLLIGQGRDPFLERVGAEIEKLGLSLVRSDAKGPLEAVARAEQALAALRVLPSRAGIEVWMADATSGRSLLRQVIVDENPDGPDRELIALQTAELLRTSLLGEKAPREPDVVVEVAAQVEPKPSDQPQDAPEDEPQAEVERATEARSAGVQLWCGALYSPGGARASLELGGSLQRFFAPRWGLGVDLGVPLWPGEVMESEGAARLGTYFVGVLALARFQPSENRLFATFGAGPALMLLSYRGETREPLRANTGRQLTGAAYLRGDVGVIATSWLRFGVRALAGASFSRISVTFAGNDAGSFGPGVFAGFAFAEVSSP